MHWGYEAGRLTVGNKGRPKASRIQEGRGSGAVIPLWRPWPTTGKRMEYLLGSAIQRTRGPGSVASKSVEAQSETKPVKIASIVVHVRGEVEEKKKKRERKRRRRTEGGLSWWRAEVSQKGATGRGTRGATIIFERSNGACAGRLGGVRCAYLRGRA